VGCSSVWIDWYENWRSYVRSNWSAHRESARPPHQSNENLIPDRGADIQDVDFEEAVINLIAVNVNSKVHSVIKS
jgi:hypothetical protein